MPVEKKIWTHLTKCYCVAPLIYEGKKRYLVASEKDYPCLLFEEDGRIVDTIWEHPGGTMSAVQIPGKDGAFLATHRFYSPNDSKQASIVMALCHEGQWKIQTLAQLPHVHRFDILKSPNGIFYLLACTLCSGRDYKDDWSHPGKIYGCRLPKDLTEKGKDYRLPLIPIRENMLKNHGYSKCLINGREIGLVTSNEGVFLVAPPEKEGADWKIRQILSDPASDGILLDLDQDGKDELLTFSPFHGDCLRIYHLDSDGAYRLAYEHPEKLPFLHSICKGHAKGKAMAVIGYRQGRRELLTVFWDEQESKYKVEVLDPDAGSANALCGDGWILSANREKDEIVCYIWKEGD